MRLKVPKKFLMFAVFVLVLIAITVFTMTQSSLQTLPTSSTSPTASTSLSDTEDEIGDPEVYNELKRIAMNQGARASWEYLIQTYSADSGGLSAHDYAHYVGKIIFEKEGLEGIKTCTADFAFGCYHGLLDQAFKKDLSKLAEAQKACEKLGDRGSGPVSSCTHGIGHGVASFYKDKDLTGALRTCDTLPDGAPQYCYDGVFMEFSRDALDDFYKPDDPLYPCNAVDPKYTYSCGRNQPPVMIHRLNKSFLEAAQTCEESKDRNLRTSCYVALGFQAVYTADQNIQKMIKSCEILADKEFQYQCKSAAAGELVFQNITNWSTNAPSICNSLEKANAKLCLEHVVQIQKSYNR